MRWLHYALRYGGMCTYIYIRMYIKCNGLETKRKQKEKKILIRQEWVLQLF